jgi:tetratricopeptide (TPR) repeat protein
MKKIPVILSLLFFFTTAIAQKKDISKISKNTAQGKYTEAQKQLDEYKAENGQDAAYLFFLVQNKIAQPLEKLELKTCVAQLQESARTFYSLNEKDREYYCKKLAFCETSSANSLKDVLKLYWNTVQKERNLEDIKQFLTEFPNQDFQSEVIQLRDELAFSSIQNSTNEDDFKSYISKYPSSAFKNKAQQKLEELAYAAADSKNTIGEFKVFIQLYPNSSLVSEAQEKILDLEWKSTKEGNDLALLRKFNSEHANCIYTTECKKLIATGEWRILSSSEEVKAIEEWAVKNAQYPEASLANAKARELKDFVLPYITKNRTFKFFYVLDKKIDETNEYKQVSRLDNGNFVVLQNNLIGMVDRKGKVILPLQFLKLEKLESNFLAFGNNKYQIISPKGEIIKDLNYKFVSTLYNNNYRYCIVWNLVNGVKKCGVIDSKGNEIIPVKYDYIEEIKSGFLLYTKGKPKNLCDLARTDGKVILSKIETANCNVDGYYIFQRNNKSGVVSSSGKILVQPIYSYITIDEPNQFIVNSDNNQRSIIDSTGNELLRSGNYNTLWHLSNGIYSVGDYQKFNLYDANSGRYFGSSGYENVNAWSSPNYLVLRKGKELEIIETATRKSIKKTNIEDHSSEDEYEGDGYDGEGEMSISEYSSTEFDEYLKPEFSVPTTAYISGSYETTRNYVVTKYSNINELGNSILIDNTSGAISVYPNYYSVVTFSNNAIGLAQNENDAYKLVDPNNKTIKESVIWASGLSDNEIVYSTNVGNLKTSYLLNTTTNKSKEIGVDISNYASIDDYSRYTFKDILIYELSDGTKLFDSNIDFNKYESDQLNSKASTNYYNKNYSEAIRLYQESLKLVPRNFSVYINLSNCYRDNYQYSDAMQWINKALIEDPVFNEGYYTSRIALYEKQDNKYGMAVDYYALATKSKYSSLAYYRLSAYYYNQTNYFYETIRVCNEAISKNKGLQKDSNKAGLYNNLGNAHFNLGQYSAALSDFNNAFKSELDYNKDGRAMYLENIGISYLNLRNNAMACKYFKQACGLGRCTNNWRCR